MSLSDCIFHVGVHNASFRLTQRPANPVQFIIRLRARDPAIRVWGEGGGVWFNPRLRSSQRRSAAFLLLPFCCPCSRQRGNTVKPTTKPAAPAPRISSVKHRAEQINPPVQFTDEDHRGSYKYHPARAISRAPLAPSSGPALR